MISVVCGFGGDVLQRAADGVIGGDAAGARPARGRAELFVKQSQADAQPVRRRFQHRGLKPAQRSLTSCGSSGIMPAGLVAHRGLQSRQREIRIRAPEHRPRKREPSGVAAQPLHRSTSGPPG